MNIDDALMLKNIGEAARNYEPPISHYVWWLIEKLQAAENKTIQADVNHRSWFDSHNNRITELTEAICNHREKTGHNLCWENDVELWKVLKDEESPRPYPHASLPTEEEFTAACKLYYLSRRPPPDNDRLYRLEDALETIFREAESSESPFDEHPSRADATIHSIRITAEKALRKK